MILFPDHCAIDLWPQFQKNGVWRISPNLFEVEIPNLVCSYIFGSVSVFGSP